MASWTFSIGSTNYVSPSKTFSLEFYSTNIG